MKKKLFNNMNRLYFKAHDDIRFKQIFSRQYESPLKLNKLKYHGIKEPKVVIFHLNFDVLVS